MPEEQQNEGMTDDQAVEAFKKLEQPRKRPAAEKKEEAKEAALEGEDQPEDEESEEAEEPETEEPETEDEEESDEDDPDSEVTVTIDGKKQRIKLGDLVKGHLRQQDYTRKTQQIAEERKKFEGELNSARQQREYYRAGLEQMRQAYDSITPAQEPDWNAFMQQHGAEKALQAKFTWDQAARQRQQIEAERQRIDAEAEAEQAEAKQKRLAEERDLMLEVIPGWKNPGKAERERKALVEFAKSAGFDDADINQITDHRAVKMLHLAWLGHQVAERQKTLKPAPEVESVRTARPSSTPRSRDALSEATKALKQSGDVEDAADVFGALLKQERRRR